MTNEFRRVSVSYNKVYITFSILLSFNASVSTVGNICIPITYPYTMFWFSQKDSSGILTFFIPSSTTSSSILIVGEMIRNEKFGVFFRFLKHFKFRWSERFFLETYYAASSSKTTSLYDTRDSVYSRRVEE